MAKALNPAGKKHRFGKAWMHEHVSDHYVQEARRLGYRSRAAFKLIELIERDRLVRPGLRVADLGAAPGSWSQVLAARVGPGGAVYALDALPMEPVPGVRFVQGDFAEEATLARFEALLTGGSLDLVVSDMAPNISGIGAVDQARSLHLAELALEFGTRWLKPGGSLVVKVFQGAGFREFQGQLAARFGRVVARKPQASRGRSPEVYVVASGFRR